VVKSWISLIEFYRGFAVAANTLLVRENAMMLKELNHQKTVTAEIVLTFEDFILLVHHIGVNHDSRMGGHSR
jgi:hypothetical protein